MYFASSQLTVSEMPVVWLASAERDDGNQNLFKAGVNPSYGDELLQPFLSDRCLR